MEGIECVHDNHEFTSTDEDERKNQGITSSNTTKMRQFVKEFNVKCFNRSEQLQRILEEINTNVVWTSNISAVALKEILESSHKKAREDASHENETFSSISHFSSGQANLSEKLNEMNRKMEGLSKNYMISILQTVVLFVMLIVIMTFILYRKFRQNRRVISLTEMSSLHMEH